MENGSRIVFAQGRGLGPGGSTSFPRDPDPLFGAMGVTPGELEGLADDQPDVDHLTALLTAIPPERLARAVAALRAPPIRPLPPITAALLHDHGLRPDLLFLVSSILGGRQDWTSDDRLVQATRMDMRDDAMVSLRISLSPTVQWDLDPEGERVVCRGLVLPETTAAAIRGRPLREVLRHPVLDLFDARIARLRATDAAERPDLHLDVELAP